MEYRIRKEILVVSAEVVMDSDYQMNYCPTAFRDQYAVQVKGNFRWHTIKTFTKIRAAAKFLRFLKNKLTDEV